MIYKEVKIVQKKYEDLYSRDLSGRQKVFFLDLFFDFSFIRISFLSLSHTLPLLRLPLLGLLAKKRLSQLPDVSVPSGETLLISGHV